jgi:hypothetical protein
VAHVAQIDEWPLGRDTKLVVSIIEYEGRWRYDARIYFRDESGVMQPGKGLGLPLKHLERFADATAKALRGAAARDLVGSGHNSSRGLPE